MQRHCHMPVLPCCRADHALQLHQTTMSVWRHGIYILQPLPPMGVQACHLPSLLTVHEDCGYSHVSVLSALHGAATETFSRIRRVNAAITKAAVCSMHAVQPASVPPGGPQPAVNTRPRPRLPLRLRVSCRGGRTRGSAEMRMHACMHTSVTHRIPLCCGTL